MDLGWSPPNLILDLLVEQRVASNGRRGFGAIRVSQVMLALHRGVSQAALRQRLDALCRILSAMLPSLDLGRALLRGRYLAAVARIEASGVPLDAMTTARLAQDWPAIRGKVVERIDSGYGVFACCRLQPGAFEAWLERSGIAWPRAGDLDLGDNVFRDMSRAHPAVRPLKELCTLLDGFDPTELKMDHDGRSRVPLRPIATRTGRNAPSAKSSVFGHGAWIRHLVRPEPGTRLALVDWSQQEFGIAAALSGDAAMQQAYRSGDPYLALAEMAGAASLDTRPDIHADVRARYKTVAIGVQYRMGAATLARLTGQGIAAAHDLLHRHRAAFPRFWQWSEAVETHALLTGSLSSIFGWRLAVDADTNPRALRNFPLQADRAEMLRLACCLATEAGIRVCLPLHDALLIEAPLDDLDASVAATQAQMAEASRIVPDGFELRSEIKVVRYPERYRDPRGAAVWQAIEQVL